VPLLSPSVVPNPLTLLADLLDSSESGWPRDPVGFVTDRLGEHLWSKQREIIESVRDHRRTAVASCHGAGKARDLVPGRGDVRWPPPPPNDEPPSAA
jgi:hypothetical protein